MQVPNRVRLVGVSSLTSPFSRAHGQTFSPSDVRAYACMSIRPKTEMAMATHEVMIHQNE